MILIIFKWTSIRQANIQISINNYYPVKRIWIIPFILNQTRIFRHRGV